MNFIRSRCSNDSKGKILSKGKDPPHATLDLAALAGRLVENQISFQQGFREFFIESAEHEMALTKKEPEQTSRQQMPWLVRILYGLALIGWFIWRLPRGADISDEGYYAGFYVAWLRSSIAETTDMSAHQPSHLIPFPFVLLFSRLVPDLTGLMLFLRILYACLATLTVRLMDVALRQGLPQPISRAIATLAAVFIPFSLPAPSYNTMGMLFLVCTACSMIDAILSRSRWSQINVGLFGALTGLAYPTLLPVSFVIVMGAFFSCSNRDGRVAVFRSFICLIAFHVLLGLVVFTVFGAERLQSISEFARHYGAYFDVQTKLSAAVEQITSPKYFLSLSLLGLAANVVGAIKRQHRVVGIVHTFLFLGILGFFYQYRAPILMFRGHEAVLFFGIVGLPVLRHLARRSSSQFESLISVVYGSAVIGGLLTSWTSANSLCNFTIGGFAVVPCVLIDWCLPTQHTQNVYSTWRSWLLVLMTLLVLTEGSVTYFYGEPTTHTVKRIKRGIYAHLWATPESAARFDRLKIRMQNAGSKNETCCMVGAFPGIYLLGEMKLKTPHSWPIPAKFERLAPVMEKYFADRSHLADVVVWFVFPHGVNKVQEATIEREYGLISHDEELRVYRRRDLVAEKK